MHNNKLNKGFSLFELIASIGILAVILSLATPSFLRFITQQQLNSSTRILFSSLQLARSQAVSTQYNTYLCPLDINALNCKKNTQQNWGKGWMVFTDINNNRKFDNNDKVIKSITIHNDIRIVFNQKGGLRFFPHGGARSAGFYLCSKKYSATRHILLLHTGRIRIKNTLSAARHAKYQQTE